MDVSRLPSYTGLLGRIWHYLFLLICALVFLLLIGPLLVIIPLSFNADSYFTFSEGMLRLDPDAFSLKWYREIFGTYEAIRHHDRSRMVQSGHRRPATVFL